MLQVNYTQCYYRYSGYIRHKHAHTHTQLTLYNYVRMCVCNVAF